MVIMKGVDIMTIWVIVKLTRGKKEIVEIFDDYATAKERLKHWNRYTFDEALYSLETKEFNNHMVSL